MKSTPAGLTAGNKPVPLLGVRYDVVVENVASRVTIAQRFRNTESQPIEAMYTFPLDEGSAVCAFEVEIGERRVIGRVEEREAAFERYDQAIADGDGAFLLDQDRPNIFTASVGNLKPNEEAVVRISYVAEIEQRGDELRLQIPTTVSPRYVPASQLRAIDPAELDHLTPPIERRVPYGFTLSATIRAASAVRSVECPSHPARVAIDGGVASVTLSGESIAMDRDVVLVAQTAARPEASALVAHDADGGRLVMLNLYPRLEGLTREPMEVIFLLDRSGSMMGPSIAQARAALQLALRSLEEGDRFNIVGFGDSFQALFAESVPYTQANLDTATKHAATVEANLGGTELMPPLHAILSTKGGGLARQLVLLTDGQVSNERECVELVAQHRETTRVFTFGIGFGASDYLVKTLARVSGGSHEMIQPNERIDEKVMRQFGRLTSASLRNVRLDWGGLRPTLVAPERVPSLFEGERVTVYAKLRDASSGTLAIRATGPAGELSFSCPIDAEKAEAPTLVGPLLARRTVRAMEDGELSAEAKRGSAQSRATSNQADTLKARVVELACRYGIASSYTSFVAVEERPTDERTDGEVELRRVPIMLTKGWHGRDELASHAVAAAPPSFVFAGNAAPGAMPMLDDAVSASAPLAKRRSRGIVDRIKGAFGIGSGGGPQPPAPAPAKPTASGRGLQAGASKTEVADLDAYAELFEEVDAPLAGGANAPTGATGMRGTGDGRATGAEDALLALCLHQRADGGFPLSEQLLAQAQRSRSEIASIVEMMGTIESGVAEAIVATLLTL
ncbi:MAG: VWA domain-containing protein, partial [Myxococcales bacterium]|nr:VWA domain-containing protein [Myxococcales bacterium]